MRSSERQVKHDLMQERGGFFSCSCELCGKAAAVDLHEIVNAAVAPRSLVRQYPALLSLLCRSCNMQAERRANARHLLMLNQRRYGAEAVRQAIAAVAQAIRRDLSFYTDLLEEEAHDASKL
jgi:hypothetical protein